nr:Os02g0722350 [Ipomoea trifida]
MHVSEDNRNFRTNDHQQEEDNEQKSKDIIEPSKPDTREDKEELNKEGIWLVRTGNWIGSDLVPRNPPNSVRGTETQNQRAKSSKYNEIGIAPVLLLPQRMKFSTVRITKAIPGKKHAVAQETDLHPSEVPFIVLHSRTPT